MKLNRRKLRRLIKHKILNEMFATDMMSDINSSMSNARYSSSGMTSTFGADDYELDALFDEVKTLFDRHIETHPLFESFSDDDVLKRQSKNMLNKFDFKYFEEKINRVFDILLKFNH